MIGTVAEILKSFIRQAGIVIYMMSVLQLKFQKDYIL